MPVEIRGITASDAPRFLKAMATPFAFDIDDDDTDEAINRFTRLFEPDRARCAFDGDSMVGTLSAFSLDMSVPGGTVSCAGTTQVTVQPTHRRRGVLRSMMQAHFEDVRDRREPVAALWASESGIYHRFGYGMATVFAEARISRDHTQLHRLSPDLLPVRLVDHTDALAAMRPVFDRVVTTRPGMFARNDHWWARRLDDRKSERQGATAFRYAVAEGANGPEGYAQYRLKPGEWDTHHADGVVEVEEIIADTPTASASLWSFVLGHDLVAEIKTGWLPEDDPLFSLLGEWRRASPRILDQMWVRIVDLALAVEARRYSTDGALTFTVHDPMDDSTTTFRLIVDGGVGGYTPATGNADIELDMEDLSAAYLGRSRFRALARAGRLSGSSEALTLADAMFGWDPAPWCQEVF